MTARVIRIEPLAPAKPAFGQPCNGCGVCCLAEPCPLGMLLSGRRQGRCDALRWDEAARRYRCGAASGVAARLPRALRPVAPLAERLARRWISAGSGCDSTLEAQAGPIER
jgi:hypothetical protein